MIIDKNFERKILQSLEAVSEQLSEFSGRLERLEHATEEMRQNGSTTFTKLNVLSEKTEQRFSGVDIRLMCDSFYLYSLFSMCQNHLFLDKHISPPSAVYKYFRDFHDATAVHQVITPGVVKTRVGRDFDGGYVMVRPFSRNKIAYSFGINDDVSWDKQMASEGYAIYQYDHTISSLPEENPAFHWKPFGLTGEDETEQLKRIETFLRENGHDNTEGMVLKMDIEGWERSVFQSVVPDTLNRFDQITVEVHNVLDPVLSPVLLDGLRNVAQTHICVHVHANCFSQTHYCGDLALADTLELTYIKKNLYEVRKSEEVFPISIDMPNRGGSPDMWMGKW